VIAKISKDAKNFFMPNPSWFSKLWLSKLWLWRA